MAGVSKKFGINFHKPRKAKRSMESKDELDVDYRKGSWGNLSPNMSLGMPVKTSKSNSLGSINSETCDNSLDHEEIMSLTHNVRSFSDALSKLKGTFCTESGSNAEEVRVAAYEKLGVVLQILKGVLQKYPALHTTDVLTSAAILISKIKSCTYEDLSSDGGDLLYHIDQLALAFSSSVSEYLMGDTDIIYPLGKTKSHDNLASTDGSMGDREDQLLASDSGVSGEEIDQMLLRVNSGINMALERAKAWAKYAKEIISYVEKRASLEAEFSKNLAKLAQTVRQNIIEESFQPFQSIYFTALDQDTDFSHTCQATCTLIQSQKFVEPLASRRAEHEKIRKNLRDQWTREIKKMHEAGSNLKKSKHMYITRQQEYERAKEVAEKAETESLAQSSAGQKAEKKRKQEEDAMHRAMEAETSYKSCIMEANLRQKEMEKVKGDILAGVRELVFQSDQIMKVVTVGYFQLLHSVTAPAPVQFQALWESSQQYEPGSQYGDFVRRLPSSTAETSHNPEPYVFEPFSPDSKSYELRKPSTHSSGSGSCDISSQLEESPTARTDSKSRLKAWHHGEEDTDSISGSSSKSQESSPTASPYQHHRKPLGGHTVSYSDVLEASEKQAVSDSFSASATTFAGVRLSRSAQSHSFRKLRTPSKCRECESYVYFQGAECEKCGLSSHRKCLESLRWECGHKPVQRRLTTFGVDFTDHVEQTHTDIPHLVRKCIAEINARGLNVQGMYRKSGVKSKVEKLCQQFETDEGHVDLCEHHPNVIANVLKLYLRQLPEPLFTFKLYPELVKLARDEQNGVINQPGEPDVLQRLVMLINVLPLPNFRTLGLLMHHLKRVTDHQETNQMTASNLGIVFGPTLLRPSEGAASLNSLIETPHQTRIIELLIQNVETVFGGEDMYIDHEDTPIEVLPPSEPENTTTDGAIKEEGETASPTAPTSGDTRWFVPTITENLLDELAREDPGFQKMVQEEYVILPGSAESKERGDPPPTEPAKDEEPAPNQPDALDAKESESDEDDHLPDRLLPDDSLKCTTSTTIDTTTSTSKLPISKSNSVSHPAIRTASVSALHRNLVASLSAGAAIGMQNSPGLRKKLLPSHVISRTSPTGSSIFYTSSSETETPEGDTKPVLLSTPRPYSPTLSSKNKANSAKSGPSLTKPGNPDIGATKNIEEGKSLSLALTKTTSLATTSAASESKSTFYRPLSGGLPKSNSAPCTPTVLPPNARLDPGRESPRGISPSRNESARSGNSSRGASPRNSPRGTPVSSGRNSPLLTASTTTSESQKLSPSLVPKNTHRAPEYV